MANEKLKWETTEQYDFGLDLGFFDGRINVTMDYYIKTTKDLLLGADVPASSGYSSATLNVGKLRNKGFELTLETINIKGKNFTWTSNFNIAFNSNKIVELNYGQDDMISFVNWDNKYKTMPAYISIPFSSILAFPRTKSKSSFSYTSGTAALPTRTYTGSG